MPSRSRRSSHRTGSNQYVRRGVSSPLVPRSRIPDTDFSAQSDWASIMESERAAWSFAGTQNRPRNLLASDGLPAVLERLAHPDPDLSVVALKHAAIPADLIEYLARDASTPVEFLPYLVESNDLSPAGLVWVAEHRPSSRLAAIAAARLDCPTAALRALHDSGIRVFPMYSNSNLPSDLMLKAAAEPEASIRQALSRNPSVTQRVVTILSRDPDENVRESLAMHCASLSRTTVQRMSKDPYDGVRSRIAMVPDASDAIRRWRRTPTAPCTSYAASKTTSTTTSSAKPARR